MNNLKNQLKQSFRPFTLILFSILFIGCGQDDGIVVDNTIQLEEYIKEEMGYQKIPALSILSFRENKILYEKHFGQSQIAQSQQLEAGHLFLLASISKVITATALLQLYDQDLFSLDDKINDYLPFTISVPNQTVDITFKMLLTHTSGIADGSALDNQYYFGQDSPVALEDFLRNYLIAGGSFYNATENFHNFQPGTRHEYSNIGNALIGVLVERISNKSFNTYCKEHIFEPLGMLNTFWRLDEITSANRTIVQPYKYENGRYQVIEHYTFTDYPNGGLRSTATDLFYFLSVIAQGGSSQNYQLLKTSTVNQMITPQIPSIDNEAGLHLFLMNKNQNLWGHDGGEEGVSTIMAFNPETKVGAIILTNQGDAELEDLLEKAYKLSLTL